MNPEAGLVGDVRDRVELLMAGRRGLVVSAAEVIQQALVELGYVVRLETVPVKQEEFSL